MSGLQLLDVPDVGMREILKRCDFRSVLTLRKVCKTLRTFIDDTKPDPKLTEITIQLCQEGIRMDVQNQKELGTFHLFYENDIGTNCMVTKHGPAKFKSVETKKKMRVKRKKHTDVFIQDLETLLKFQKKTALEKLYICFEVEDNIQFLKTLNNYLANVRKEQLKVKNIGWRTYTQSQILKILPFIDERVIEEIYFANSQPSDLNMNMVRTNQWHSAKKLSIFDFTPHKMNYCLHFKEVIGHCTAMTKEDVKLFKEKFLRSPCLKSLGIHYLTIDEKVYDELGRNCYQVRRGLYNQNMPTKRWFYDTEDYNKKLCLEVGASSLKLNYVDRVDLPKGVLMNWYS